MNYTFTAILIILFCLLAFFVRPVDHTPLKIELKDIHEALQIQKIAIHAGVIAEVFENNAEKRHTIKFLDEHSSPTVEVQRVAGIGNFAASVLVEHMEKKKIVVRVKNNYCYKTYFV